DPVRDREAGAAGKRSSGLHADHAQPRTARFQRKPDAGAEPPAADRYDDGLDLVELVRELEPDRPLSRDHELVLERVHERRATLLDVLARSRERLLDP